MAASKREHYGVGCICDQSDQSLVNAMPQAEEQLATLGHEIRNPLSALSYSLQAWPASNDDPHLTQHLLQIMRRQVAQLTRLCNDLLDTGRNARGSLTIFQEQIDLGQVIRNACEEIQSFVEQCGHKLTISLGNAPLVVLGDESRLTQVFANLIHNSAKFTDRNGQLSITVEREANVVVVYLRDNGNGICAEKLRTIFNGTSHSNTSDSSRTCTSAVIGGLGIGLRLAKSIVELHGGTIDAHSQGAGQGSTFVVRLPLAPDTSLNTESPVQQQQAMIVQASAPRLRQYQIVVVDDDRTIRFLMTRLLQQLGQTVTAADNGDAALEAITKIKPQVVFLDLEMRGMSGFELARELRAREEFDRTVVVAISGNSDSASRSLAIKSGFDHYLVKPTTTAELAALLQHVDEPSNTN